MGVTTTLIGLLMCATLPETSAQEGAKETAEAVVVLHGMGRSKLSMLTISAALKRAGYQVVNLNYPSTSRSVDECAQVLALALQERRLDSATKLHFVTHSLGGIVVRALLQRHPQANLGRVVMLSPPNQGSEMADEMMSGAFRGLYRWTTGPAGQELGTGPKSTPNCLGPVNFPLGVITGDRRITSTLAHAFSGPNDGKVAVERAKVDGMLDFLVVPHTHSFIMRSSRVCRETVHFLQHGRFSHASA